MDNEGWKFGDWDSVKTVDLFLNFTSSIKSRASVLVLDKSKSIEVITRKP